MLNSNSTVRNFKERFCETYGCKPEEYEKKVLFMSLYGSAKLICRLFWLVDRDYFNDDLELIRILAATLDRAELKQEISKHRFARPKSSLLRGFFKLRISSHKLIGLATNVFPMKVITLPRQQADLLNPDYGS